MSLSIVRNQYSIDGFYRPFSVLCGTLVGENKYHFVFTLPKKYLRHRATTFKHFRTSYEAKNVERCFHFFLDFIDCMVSESKNKKEAQPKGKNSLAFVESGCHQRRLKLNSTLLDGGFMCLSIGTSMNSEFLKIFSRNFEKNVQKLISRGKTCPEHYHINTMASYGSKVYRVYSGESGNIEQLYQDLTDNCSVSPSSLFKMKDIEGSIYSIDSYENETGEFTFPSHNFFRIDTEQISYKLSENYLPDHVMFSFAKPEVRISYEPFQVEFLPHRYYKEYHITQNNLEEFISEKSDSFIISEPCEIYRSVFDIGEVCYSNIRDEHDVWLDTNDLEDMIGSASAAYEKMRCNQHDLATMDHITLTAIDKDDKFTYIEQEFLTHVWNDPDCFASKPIKSIVRWFKKEYDPELIQPFPLVHKNISVCLDIELAF